MRKILCLLILVLTLIACKNEVSFKDLEKKDGLLLFNQKPYTGKVLNKLENDTLIEIFGVKKGLKDGEYLKYYRDGTIEIKGYYASGKIDSVWNYYYKNGSKELQVNFREGEINGKFMEYNYLGHLVREIQNLKGIIGQEDSVSTNVFSKAFIFKNLDKYNIDGFDKGFTYIKDSSFYSYRKTFYKDNIMLSNEWGDVDKIKDKDTIFLEKRITKYFYKTNQPNYEAQYFLGSNDSLYLSYEFTTNNTENAKGISYFENGKISSITNYKILKSKNNLPYNTVLDGESLTYNDSGKLLKKEKFKNGKRVVDTPVSNYGLIKGIYKMKKDGYYYNFYLFLNKNGIAVLNAGLRLSNPKYGKYTLIGNKVKVNWENGGSFQGNYLKNSGIINVSSSLSWVFYDNL